MSLFRLQSGRRKAHYGIRASQRCGDIMIDRVVMWSCLSKAGFAPGYPASRRLWQLDQKMRGAASVFCPFAPVENFNPTGRHRLLTVPSGRDTRRLTLSKSYYSDVCYYSYGYGARVAGPNRVDRTVCAAARARPRASGLSGRGRLRRPWALIGDFKSKVAASLPSAPDLDGSCHYGRNDLIAGAATRCDP